MHTRVYAEGKFKIQNKLLTTFPVSKQKNKIKTMNKIRFHNYFWLKTFFFVLNFIESNRTKGQPLNNHF